MSSDLPNLAAQFKSRRTPAAAANPAASTPAPQRGNPSARRNVGVWLPAEIRHALQARSKQRGVTLTYIVEEAFNQHGANYSALRDSSGTAFGMPDGGEHRARGSRQIQLRLTPAQAAWLDEQVDQFGAPSRSALVTAVLRRHFGIPETPR